VIVPAYCCPDVISAVLFAGARPVLVDLEAETPWMDLTQVSDRLGSSTVAVVAVNFLGVPERAAPLRKLADAAGALLVDDCAQFFPLEAAEREWLLGDFVVLSFGRGKPLSLLGGG